MHEAREELFVEEAFAQHLVAVHMAACILFAVVEVDSTEILLAYQAVELLEAEHIAHLGREVVAGGEGVAGVYADAHAALVVDACNDAGDVLELPSEVGALSGGVLDDGRHALCLAQCHVHLAGYLVKAFLFAYLVQMAAGVEVEHGEAQLLCSLHLVEEGSAGFLKGLLVG